MATRNELHLRSTSRSSSSEAGETMSPSIFPVDRKDPIQSVGGAGVCGGTTSATGSPKRVISTGCLVFRTRSKTAGHFALNLEMAISSMDRASLPWSTPMVGQTLGIAEQARLLILLGTGRRVAPNLGSRKARPVSCARESSGPHRDCFHATDVKGSKQRNPCASLRFCVRSSQRGFASVRTLQPSRGGGHLGDTPSSPGTLCCYPPRTWAPRVPT